MRYSRLANTQKTDLCLERIVILSNQSIATEYGPLPQQPETIDH